MTFPPAAQQHTAPSSGLRLPAHRVHRRAQYKWHVSALIGWTIFLGLLGGGYLASRFQEDFLEDGEPIIPDAISLSVLGFLALFAAFRIVVVPILRYRIHRWEVTDQAIYTRTGWLTIDTLIVPINRVQNVETVQSAIDRMLSLAKVEAKTAANSIFIGLIHVDDARRLTDELTSTMAADESDATG